MKEGMEITDLQVCLLLAMHMNPHERGYLHNYIHIEICKRPIFFSPFPRVISQQSTPDWGGGDFKV